jgi:hypothetical protein
MRVLLCLVLAGVLGSPNTASADQLPKRAKLHLDEFAKSRDRDELLNAVGTDVFTDYLVDLALDEHPDRVELAERRTDLQLGALTGGTGSTSIVARPGISEFLSAALESGAATRKVDDTAFTLNVNALMLSQVLRGEIPRGCGSLDDVCRQGAGRWLRGLSGSATFAVGNSRAAAAGAKADEAAAFVDNNQLTALSMRYELLVRERNVAKVQAALEAARTALQTAAAAFLPKQEALETRIQQAMDAGWKDETLKLLEAETSPAGREAVLLRRYQLLRATVEASAEITQLRAAAFKEYRAYVVAQNKLLAEKLYRKALTVDYLHERPTGQPALEQVRMVFSTPLGRKLEDGLEVRAPKGSFTMNAGLSFFDPQVTSNGWKVRDGQFSAALDWTPNPTGTIRATFTAAYYFQYMIANGVLKFDKTAITPGGAAIPLPKTATELLNTKGDIHVAQFRVSIPAAQGVTFPLAITYSSRTELLKADKGFWQGHAGVSYDLGALKQLLLRQ